MRTNRIFAIAAAVAALAACTKEQAIETGSSFKKGQEVTLNVMADASATKVTSELNGTAVDFKWEEGDKIKVKVGADSAVFTITSFSADSTVGTFTGTMPAAGDTFSVQYPVADPDLSTQAYSSTEAIPHDMMKFAADSCSIASPSFTLKPQYAALRLNLYGTDQTVSKIVVTNTTSSRTYSLNISGGKFLSSDITNPTPFFIVVPAGSWNFSAEVINEDLTTIPESQNIIKGLFTIEAGSNTFSPSSAQTFTAGQILNMDAMETTLSAPTKVYFSKGNLYYDGSTSTWGFEANQYDYRTYAGANSCIGGTVSDTGTPAGNWGTFGWVGASSTTLTDDLTKYGMSISTNSSDYGTSTTDTLKADWADISTLPQISGRKWKTMTLSEVLYLLSTRTVTVGGEIKESYGDGNVNGVKGWIILPDNWDGSVCSGFTYGPSEFSNTFTESTWSDMENAGCVFLPTAGYRYGSSLYGVGLSGFYWLSTPSSSSKYGAYCLYFYSDNFLMPSTLGLRSCGYSVRLVSAAQ